MSGIAGIVLLDGRRTEPADVSRMIATLAHRGPDASDIWCGQSVGLGHAMLRTTPESLRESLPLRHDLADLVITADARIDNRAELIGALDLRDRSAGDIPDSELILLAYKRWGEACPARLLGDFAFAIWDGRRQTLFCARDHFGVKPFYYHAADRLFAFASEIKGLLALADVPRRLNEVRVADYLVPLFEDKEITFYRDILRLPPAHSMTVSRVGVRKAQYWALDPTREIRYRTDAEYADAFREIFTEAVRCRLRTAFPIGSMLSGGLDSSSVVCVARRLLAEENRPRLHTFSVVFDDATDCDESRYFKAVIAQGGVEAHFIPRLRVDPSSDFESLLRDEVEPLSVPALFLYGALYRDARTHGVRVLLDGIDGDSTVSHGLAYLTELAGRGRWVRAIKEALTVARRQDRSAWHLLRAWAVVPYLPRPVLRAWRFLRGRRGPQWSWNGIVHPAFAREIDLASRYESLGSDRKPARTAKDQHLKWMTRGVYPFVLELMDRISAAVAVEPRHVGFDVRVAEFCLALPGEQKLRDGWTRLVMRRAMDTLLPDAVRSRAGKSDVSPGLIQALVDFQGCSAETAIAQYEHVIGRYANVDAIRRAHKRYLSTGSQEHALRVWWAISLARWLNTAELTQ